MNIYLTDQEINLLENELCFAAGRRSEQISNLKSILKRLTADEDFFKEHLVFFEEQLKQDEEELEVLNAVTRKLVQGG